MPVLAGDRSFAASESTSCCCLVWLSRRAEATYTGRRSDFGRELLWRE